MRSPPPPNSWLIGIWLAGLMLLGVIVAEASGHVLPLPHAAVIALILILSTVKATLVALYFMHLRSDRRILAFIALTPLVLILCVLGLLLSSRFVKI